MNDRVDSIVVEEAAEGDVVVSDREEIDMGTTSMTDEGLKLEAISTATEAVIEATMETSQVCFFTFLNFFFG